MDTRENAIMALLELRKQIRIVSATLNNSDQSLAGVEPTKVIVAELDTISDSALNCLVSHTTR